MRPRALFEEQLVAVRGVRAQPHGDRPGTDDGEEREDAHAEERWAREPAQAARRVGVSERGEQRDEQSQRPFDRRAERDRTEVERAVRGRLPAPLPLTQPGEHRGANECGHHHVETDALERPCRAERRGEDEHGEQCDALDREVGRDRYEHRQDRRRGDDRRHAGGPVVDAEQAHRRGDQPERRGGLVGVDRSVQVRDEPFRRRQHRASDLGVTRFVGRPQITSSDRGQQDDEGETEHEAGRDAHGASRQAASMKRS